MKTRILAACAALTMAVSGMALADVGASAATSHARPDASANSCKYRQDGSYWVCITPGAYCPRAAYNHYGLDKYNLGRKYWCKNNNGWRWEPNE
jgi:hypothetical protein